MAKSRSQVDIIAAARQMQTEQEYVTSRGYRLIIRAVNPVQIEMALNAVEREMRAEGAQLDPPMWSIASEVPGRDASEQERQWFPHTEDTLDDPDDPRQTRINRARWAAYQAAQEQLLSAQGERRMELFLTYGVEIDGEISGIPEPANVEERLAREGGGTWLQDPAYWQAFQRQMGIEVPDADDLTALRLHWLQTVACDAIDLAEMQIVWQVMSNPAGLEPDELDSFRSDIIGQVRRGLRASFARSFNDIESRISGVDVVR